MENEELKQEELPMEEAKNETEVVAKNKESSEETELIIQNFNAISKKSNTKVEIFTNITDNKKIFNLESKVDNLLNDFENSIIEVKEVLVKRFIKPMKEPIVDEETGEILKDKEISMSCILLDKNGVSYATGSKIFAIQMMKYIEMFGIEEDGFIIKITKNKVKDSQNKALGFELV